MGRAQKRERKKHLKEKSLKAALKHDKNVGAFFLREAKLWATEKEEDL